MVSRCNVLVCLNCDPWSFMCISMGSIFVSVCRWCVFVSSVHPVIARSAEFCIVCNLFLFVFDMMGDQIVLAYSKMGLIIGFVCYVERFFGLPPVCCCECFHDVHCLLSFLCCVLNVF